jgi:molybdate transport system substrate-binding protein
VAAMTVGGGARQNEVGGCVMKKIAGAVAITAALLLQGAAARADELKVLSAGVMRFALKDAGDNFQRMTGTKLAITYDSAGNIKGRFEKGEQADVVILLKPDIAALAKSRKIAPASAHPIARTALAVAVRKGQPKPDISSPAAVKKSLLEAKSIAYFDPSPKAGNAEAILFERMFTRLGIAKPVAAKAKLLKSGQEWTDEKTADIIINWMPALLAKAAEYDTVGPLPAQFQDPEHSTWAAGASTKSADLDIAKDLCRVLASPESFAAFKAKGYLAP